MRRTPRTLLLGSLVILCVVIALKAAVLFIPSGTWAPKANLAEARANSSAALLADGRILITGGDGASGPLATVEFFNTDGSVSPAAPMNAARSKHISVVLSDGRVLVAGGIVPGGGVTNAAEIYDPIANTWTSLAGGMIEARSGATAALLQDQRVFIAGGDSASVVSSTVEIFDPNTGTFSFAGTLSSPRTQQAMALLADGRVLMIGGSNGSVPLASSDIFDPVAGTIVPGPSLATPRSGHSATTLLNGQVLVAGGNNIVTNPDGSTTSVDLASAEIFDPSAGTFTASASALAAPRQGHLAFLLPHNNNVLIVGGTSSGAPVASSELFTPWTGNFSATGSLATARSNASGSALQQDGLLLVAGGKDSSGASLVGTELYGFATVKTDQADYAPGTTVTITGSGWQPGETVTLNIHEIPFINNDRSFVVTADTFGNIFNSDYSPEPTDIGFHYYLTAVGSVSQAQTTFKDAGNFTYSPLSQSFTIVPGGSSSFTQSVTDPKNNNALTASPVVTGTGPTATRLPASWVSTSPTSLNFASSSSDQTGSWNVTVTVPSGTTPANYTGTIGAHATGCTQCPNDGMSPTALTVVVVAKQVATVSVGSQTGTLTFGTAASATYTVAVNRNGATGTAFSANLSLTTSLPSGATASFSPSTVSFTATD